MTKLNPAKPDLPKPTLVYVNIIAAPPEKVWRGLTDPAFTARYWYGTRVESDWKVGSPITFVKPEGSGPPDTGKVLVADRPRTLSFSWHIVWGEMAKEKDSRVTFTIEPDGAGSKLTLVHDEFDQNSQAAAALKNGWPGILAGLKKTLES